MKICQIKPQTRVDRLEVKVISKEIARDVTTFRGSTKVCTTIVEDDTGEIKLTLWDNQIDIVKVGDNVLLEDGWAKEFKGELYVSTGKIGTLRVLNEEQDKNRPSSSSWEDEVILQRQTQDDPIKAVQRNIDPLWEIHDGN